MRTRLGAPLAALLVGLLGAFQCASAAHFGAADYDGCSQPCCDAQSCFPACQQQVKTCYKLVWENETEKRWHTTYKTGQETGRTTGCKTRYREECKTRDRTGADTCYHTVQVCGQRPCVTACRKECEQTVCGPCVKTCEKEVCETVCKPVCETCYKDVCCTVCKPVCETCYKDVCVTCYNTVQETCYKDCVKTVSRPVCTMKTVQKKCGEWCTETYCVPGKRTSKWVDCCECCFDPCTCQTVTKHKKCKVCCEGEAKVCTRKAWKERTVCEQVPCTTYVTEVSLIHS